MRRWRAFSSTSAGPASGVERGDMGVSLSGVQRSYVRPRAAQIAPGDAPHLGTDSTGDHRCGSNTASQSGALAPISGATARTERRRPYAMVIAADYPFMDVLGGSMIIFFVWVAWIWTLIMIISDLFRPSRHLGMGQGRVGRVPHHPAVPRRARVPDRQRSRHGPAQRTSAHRRRSRSSTSTCSRWRGGRRRRGEPAREGQGTPRQRRPDPGGVRRVKAKLIA